MLGEIIYFYAHASPRRRLTVHGDFTGCSLTRAAPHKASPQPNEGQSGPKESALELKQKRFCVGPTASPRQDPDGSE